VIDFRYHVVSLISVFLALAVGIALGAGPLKATIGDTLTGQVQQLRGEKDNLRTQLDDSNSDLGDATSYIDATAGRMLPGSLAQRRVAVVALGSVPDKQRKAITDRLAQANATVSADVTLNSTWTDPAQRAYRQALTSRMLPHMTRQPDQGATADEQLAAALVQGLVDPDVADPNRLSDDAQSLLDVLSSKEAGTPLISVKGDVKAPADAVVVIAVPLGESGSTASPAATPEATASHVAVLTAAQKYSTGAVLADGPRGSGSLTDAVLSDDTLAATISTVSATGDVPGQVSVPLALAARIGDTVGHFGFGVGEKPLPPAVALPLVDRTPKPQGPAAPTATATAGSQG
jgi:hypothetical protein